LEALSRESGRSIQKPPPRCWGSRSGAADLDIENLPVLKEMADDMSIDKKEPNREGSEDSMELNSPTPEAEIGAPQENAAQQKRKGGRKPVRCFAVIPHLTSILLKVVIDLCYF
jgi:hypothetical protein